MRDLDRRIVASLLAGISLVGIAAVHFFSGQAHAQQQTPVAAPAPPAGDGIIPGEPLTQFTLINDSGQTVAFYLVTNHEFRDRRAGGYIEASNRFGPATLKNGERGDVRVGGKHDACVIAMNPRRVGSEQPMRILAVQPIRNTGTMGGHWMYLIKDPDSVGFRFKNTFNVNDANGPQDEGKGIVLEGK